MSSLGKKGFDGQQLSYVISHVWKCLVHNLIGKKVFLASAFKAVREKALNHLKKYFIYIDI